MGMSQEKSHWKRLRNMSIHGKMVKVEMEVKVKAYHDPQYLTPKMKSMVTMAPQ
jgi:hypothetical protein